MEGSELRFKRWRIALGAFGVLMLLASLEGLFHDIRLRLLVVCVGDREFERGPPRLRG